MAQFFSFRGSRFLVSREKTSRPDLVSFTTGCPCSARWTLIWCLRPVTIETSKLQTWRQPASTWSRQRSIEGRTSNKVKTSSPPSEQCTLHTEAYCIYHNSSWLPYTISTPQPWSHAQGRKRVFAGNPGMRKQHDTGAASLDTSQQAEADHLQILNFQIHAKRELVHWPP